MSTRRTIVATAGAITLTVLAGSAALAANLGLLDDADGDQVGDLSPVTTQVESQGNPARNRGPRPSTAKEDVEMIVVDEYVTVPGRSGATSAVTTPPATALPPATPAPPATFDDDFDGDLDDDPGDDSDTQLDDDSEGEDSEGEDEVEHEDEEEHEEEEEHEYEGAEDDD